MNREINNWFIDSLHFRFEISLSLTQSRDRQSDAPDAQLIWMGDSRRVCVCSETTASSDETTYFRKCSERRPSNTEWTELETK